MLCGQVSAGLDRMNVETLRARFDPAAMAAVDLYPNGWSSEDFDHLAPHFTELRRFYRTAADGGQAVLLALT
jgi:hypothetical protein